MTLARSRSRYARPGVIQLEIALMHSTWKVGRFCVAYKLLRLYENSRRRALAKAAKVAFGYRVCVYSIYSAFKRVDPKRTPIWL
jgi:hypothetical protein